MGRRDVNMLEGSIYKGLLTIALPVMVMNVLQSLFNIIDMTVLKNFKTGMDNAVGAVAACGSLITMLNGLVIGVATGANVIIARNIGRKDQQSVDRAIASAMAFSVTAGLALAVIGVSGSEQFLKWTNCDPVLLPQATLYFRMYFAGVPILMIYNFCAAILRSSGDSFRPMIFLTVGGLAKVAMNFLLVARFRLGVMGVAIATIIAWCVFLSLGLTVLIRNKGTVKVNLKNIRFYKREIKDILFIGVPAGLQQALYSVANVVITATVNLLGEDATTGMGIANNYDGILYQICTATALAVMPYVSQNIGAGNIKRAKQSVWKGIVITVFLGAFFGALSAIFSGQLSSIMATNDAQIAYSRQKMIIISSTYFICGINDIFGSALRGMGKPIPATVCTLLYMCAFRFVWVYGIYPLLPHNLTFLYLVWPIGWILSIATLLFVFFPTLKKISAQHALPAKY